MAAPAQLRLALCALLLACADCKLTQGEPKDEADRIDMLFTQFDILVSDGRITKEEVVATVKGMMNSRLADPLDEEGAELLDKITKDLDAKYDGNHDGVIEREEAKKSWFAYAKENKGAKEEL